MKCLNCNKDLNRHSEADLNECIASLGVEKGNKSAVEIASELGLSLKINYRHNAIVFKGKEYQTDNIEKEILKLCLMDDDVDDMPLKAKKKKKQVEEPLITVEPIEESWKSKFKPFNKEDTDGESTL